MTLLISEPKANCIASEDVGGEVPSAEDSQDHTVPHDVSLSAHIPTYPPPVPTSGAASGPHVPLKSTVLSTLPSFGDSLTRLEETSHQNLVLQDVTRMLHTLAVTVTEENLANVGGKDLEQVVEDDDKERIRTQDEPTVGLEESLTELVTPDTHPQLLTQQITPSTHSAYLASCHVNPVVVRSSTTGKVQSLCSLTTPKAIDGMVVLSVR